MPYLNSVTLMGHLTADPELRSTPGGDPVTNFSVAINSRGGEGKPKRADYFDVDLFGGWAENLCKTARKGALVIVQGHLVQEQWIDKETNAKRSRIKVRAQRAFHIVAQYAGEETGEPEGEPGAEAGEL